MNNTLKLPAITHQPFSAKEKYHFTGKFHASFSKCVYGAECDVIVQLFFSCYKLSPIKKLIRAHLYLQACGFVYLQTDELPQRHTRLMTSRFNILDSTHRVLFIPFENDNNIIFYQLLITRFVKFFFVFISGDSLEFHFIWEFDLDQGNETSG